MINIRSKTLPMCPVHHRELVRRSGKYGDFYGCPKYPECSITGSRGKHTPWWYVNDQEMRTYRTEVHARFDYIWREARLMSRGRAYKTLARLMRIPPQECHLQHFDAEQLREADEIATWMLAGGLEARAKGRVPFENEEDIDT